MAVRVPPGPEEVETLLLGLVKGAAEISVTGELELKVAYASNSEEHNHLGMLLLDLKNTALEILPQCKGVDCAISVAMWDPPLAGLTKRYAAAFIADRFGNLYMGGYPDPNLVKVKGWRVAMGRHMPAATALGMGGLHGQPQVLIEDELKDCPGDYRGMEMVVATALALRIYANPGEISEGDPWKRLRKLEA